MLQAELELVVIFTLMVIYIKMAYYSLLVKDRKVIFRPGMAAKPGVPGGTA